ncbi:dual specificity protein phosphatase 12 [Thozetella sp. PMI_491]|nr:dual specificity protein phosphatase 12 [Thozetella sp. PMI_491]
MALNRIDGRENLYVGGVFAFRNTRTLEETKITHVLSVIKYSVQGLVDQNGLPRRYQHLSIDIDDVEDEDILVHLPKMVRFIERGLYGDAAFPDDISPPPAAPESRPADGSATAKGESPPGAVFVHCAMGKSRSVSAVVAYLLWKYPHRFGRADPTTTAQTAVSEALKWVQTSRPIAEPNPSFMRQLELWWELGCPTESDNAVEDKPAYQRWLYKREVQESARIGKAPDWLRFEDEEEEGSTRRPGTSENGGSGLSLRCKKCRRVLATGPFVVPHQGTGNAAQACPHIFIEPLSWMRPTLEQGTLDGRLACPNTKCGASIGRYSWKGFKCGCDEWVCPAFSLQRSKVDEVRTAPHGPSQASKITQRFAALSIRNPPRSSPNTEPAPLNGAIPKENL